MLSRGPWVLKSPKTAREAELEARIESRLRDLREFTDARREGVPIVPGDETAENLLRAGIIIDARQLEAEQAARLRKPLLRYAWAGGIIGIGAGWALGSGEVAVASLGGVVAFHLLLARKTEPKQDGPSRYVHPHITPTMAYRIAGENERFTRAALTAIYGKEAMEAMMEDAEEQELEVVVTPIVFRTGEYPGLLNQEVHQMAAEMLAMRVRNMDREWPALNFHVLYGDAGRGKTTMVKVLAQEIRDRLGAVGLPPGDFVEAWGSDLTNGKKLDKVVRLAASTAGSVLFIDEIHSIPGEVAEKLYMLTDRDFRYKYEGDPYPTALRPFTLLGATTDLGKLHPAFRSRAERVPLELVPPEKLLALVLGMPYEVEPEAARLAVARTRWDGMPRATISIVEFAREFAKSEGRDKVGLADVEKAVETRRLDEWGLGPFHRDVVRALARSPVVVARGTKGERVEFKLSETSLLAMAKVDMITFREELRPALMDRGFLVTTSGGQKLTDAGLEYAREKGLIS